MLENAEYLRNIGAAAHSKEDGQLHPTAAGMLMFGDEYNIVRNFQSIFLITEKLLIQTGDNPDVPSQKNGYRNCASFTQ